MISGIKVTGYHQSSGLFYVIIQCLSQHFFSKSVADAKPPPYFCALCVIDATCKTGGSLCCPPLRTGANINKMY